MQKNSSNSSIKKSGNTRAKTKVKPQISPSKHWCFTLNNYTPEDITLLMGSSSIHRLSMQEETGNGEDHTILGTPHLQGYLEFKTKKRPISVFKQLSQCAHWEKTRNISASIAYTQKGDTRTGLTYLRNIKKFREVKCLKKEELYEWQKYIVEEIETEPDDRTINWIWEDVGNRGKSALVKYLVVNHGAILISGKSADIKFQLASAQAGGYYPDVILYDIPRVSQGYVNYSALEEVKNGVFTSTKYESKMMVMPHPHIYCFANFEPNTEIMSKDRWSIREI